MSLPSETGRISWAVGGGRRPAPTGLQEAVPVPVSPDLVDHREEDAAGMVESLLALWAAAGAVFLVAMAAVPPQGSRLVPLVALVLFGLAGLDAVVRWRRRLPAWSAEACSWACQVAIGVVVWGYGADSAPFTLFYAWFAVHAFWFLPWRRAACQLAVVAVTYGVALDAGGGGGLGLQSTLMLATLVAVCTFVAVLRRRFDCLVQRLAETAATDRLTGMGNRHTFDEMMEREFERARRANEPLSLVLGDLDGFKAVNDRYGHRAGDEVLRRVAAVLCENCRRAEPPMRLGGDEFAFVLVATDAAVAHHFAERVREAIRAEFAGDALPITISLGLASYPKHSPGLADLFRAADDAVYAAKGAGSNRTVVGGSYLTVVPDASVDVAHFADAPPALEGTPAAEHAGTGHR